MDIFGKLGYDPEDNEIIDSISTSIDNFSDQDNVYKCINPTRLISTTFYDRDELFTNWKPWNCVIQESGFINDNKFYKEFPEDILGSIETCTKVKVYQNGNIIETQYYKE